MMSCSIFLLRISPLSLLQPDCNLKKDLIKNLLVDLYFLLLIMLPLVILAILVAVYVRVGKPSVAALPEFIGLPEIGKIVFNACQLCLHSTAM